MPLKPRLGAHFSSRKSRGCVCVLCQFHSRRIALCHLCGSERYGLARRVPQHQSASLPRGASGMLHRRRSTKDLAGCLPLRSMSRLTIARCGHAEWVNEQTRSMHRRSLQVGRCQDLSMPAPDFAPMHRHSLRATAKRMSVRDCAQAPSPSRPVCVVRISKETPNATRHDRSGSDGFQHGSVLAEEWAHRCRPRRATFSHSGARPGRRHSSRVAAEDGFTACPAARHLAPALRSAGGRALLQVGPQRH